MLIMVPSAGHAQNVLVPWYVYPAHYDPAAYLWDDLAASSTIHPLTVIVNPADGPGANGPNADYQVGLAQLDAANVRLLGYVTTRLPGVPLRPIADVKAEVDAWALDYAAYEIEGIFVDGTSSAAADVGYFEEVYTYIRATAGFGRVVLNPGVTPAREYYERATADTIVAFEGAAAAWNSHVAPSYFPSGAPQRNGAMIYGVSTEAAMKSALGLAKARGFGHVYVTHDLLPNPWDTLPSYWTAELLEVRKLATAPTPVPALGALASFAGALALLLLASRLKATSAR